VKDTEAVSIVNEIITRQETAIRMANVRIAEQEVKIIALRTECDKLRGRYESAVLGRASFRKGFREWRDKAMRLEAWMAEYGWPLMDELEGWQNGKPPTQIIDAAERQLGEALAALDVAEEAAG